METKEIIKNVVEKLNEKKANNVKAYSLKHLDAIFDYFIIASTSNTTHVKSLSAEVEILLKKINKKISHIETDLNFNWVLIDCDEIIINIFNEKTREFYNLESLWADALEISF